MRITLELPEDIVHELRYIVGGLAPSSARESGGRSIYVVRAHSRSASQTSWFPDAHASGRLPKTTRSLGLHIGGFRNRIARRSLSSGQESLSTEPALDSCRRDMSPINYLILIGKIDLLKQLYTRILIAPAVLAELKHPLAPITGLGCSRADVGLRS